MWPIDWSFCKIICSLIADSETAEYAFQYLTNVIDYLMIQVDSFTDYLRLGTDYDPSLSSESNRYSSRGSSIVKECGVFPIHVPAGRNAFLISKDPNVVIVDYSYSGWHMMMSFLDSFLHANYYPDSVHIGNPSNVLEILKLFNLILTHGDEDTHDNFFNHLSHVPSGPNMELAYGENAHEKFAGIVCEIMNKCCSSGALHTNTTTAIVTSAMNSMKVLLKRYPFIIWKNLRTQRLFPQNTNFSQFSSTSYMQQFIIPEECALGSYEATLAYLELVLSLVQEAQLMNRIDPVKRHNFEIDFQFIKAEILSGSIIFILRELFVAYSTWRYINIDHKLQIGNNILKIFNAVIDDTVWYNDQNDQAQKNTTSASITQTLIFESFTKRGTYQIAPLLNIIGLGYLFVINYRKETPLRYHKVHRRKEFEHIEEAIMAALKLLKMILLHLVRKNEGVSALESCIFDRAGRSVSGKHVELIQTIAGYVTYEYSSFSVHAIEILNLLCVLSSKPGRPVLSLVGYFGGEAFSLCSNFVNLCNDQSDYAASDPRVQAAIISFATTVINTQSGLGATLLTGSPQSVENVFSAENLSLKSEILETSILHPVILFLCDWKRYQREKPIVLASSIFLLVQIWRKGNDHRGTLEKLRKRSELWSALISIISEPKSFANDLECEQLCYFQYSQAQAIRLLALECRLCFLNPAEEFPAMIKEIFAALNRFFSSNLFFQEEFPYDMEITKNSEIYLEELNYGLNLKKLRSMVWNDPFDSSRPYGCNFVFNANLLADRKIELPTEEDHDKLVFLN